MSAILNSQCPSSLYKTKILTPKEGCISVLEQDMMLRENYKYVILYDMDLQGETITVPEGSILSFQGGTLKNGTIIGQDTFIENSGDFDEIWGEGLIREGTWRTGIDTALDETSDHAVENRVVTQVIRELQQGLVNTDNNFTNYYTKTEIDGQQEAQDEEIDKKANSADLATVATSGSYNDLKDKPAINDGKLTIQKNGVDISTFTANSALPATANIVVPTKISDVTDDIGVAKAADVQNKIGNVGNGSVKDYVDQKIADLVNGAPATLDTLGEIADALGKDANLSTTLLDEIGSKVDKETGKGLSENDFTDEDKAKLDGIASKAEVNVQSDWAVSDTSSDAYIKNKPTNVSAFTNDAGYLTSGDISGKTDDSDLATVAKTGSYNDLSNKPTIPVVYNATLTIQRNGVTVKTFTANASADVIANIAVPTKTSELTNDSGFINSSPDLSPYALKSSIPTKTSQLTNDSGYITSAALTSLNNALTALTSRVAELEKLWYLASDGKVRTVGDKAAAAGGFYDTTI